MTFSNISGSAFTRYALQFFAVILLSCNSNVETQLAQERVEWPIFDFSDSISARWQLTNNAQYAAVAFSNIGNWKYALRAFDAALPIPAMQDAGELDTVYLKGQNALEYIANEARKYRIVIINEAHHVSYHRYFSSLLIEKLSSDFHHLGIEALSNDTVLMSRGYPTLQSGHFTAEPQFGNLIRKALSLNYKVFAYDMQEATDSKSREIAQAKCIAAVLNNDSAARIIIHCGYSHVLEGDYPPWGGKTMAGYLSDFTGEDPLTIDQVELTEHSLEKFENGYYKSMSFQDFTVIVPKAGGPPVNFRMADYGAADLYVYHPRTQIQHGRPHWLFFEKWPYFPLKHINIRFPVIIRAYLESDPENATPIDIIELKGPDSVALALYKGRIFKLIIHNPFRDTVRVSIKS